MSIELTRSSELKVSVCSLCRDDISTRALHDHVSNLFPYNTEYIIIDNSKRQWDCYDAIRHFLKESQGDLIVVIHDDVKFGNLSAALLLERIHEISIKDETAVLFGMAGISRKNQRGVGHFYDSTGEQLWGARCAGEVSSLDECFLVIKRGMGLTVSKGLNGYHFYGTDLCLNAMKSGYSCHVIDYPLIHKSSGSMNENFFEARDRFESHLKNHVADRFVRTTCTVLYGGKSKLKDCLALALSYILLETPRHRDFDVASRCILKRGHSRYGWVLFQLMIQVARFKKAYETFSRDVKWWGRNWKQHLSRRLS